MNLFCIYCNGSSICTVILEITDWRSFKKVKVLLDSTTRGWCPRTVHCILRPSRDIKYRNWKISFVWYEDNQELKPGNVKLPCVCIEAHYLHGIDNRNRHDSFIFQPWKHFVRESLCIQVLLCVTCFKVLKVAGLRFVLNFHVFE